MGGFRCGARRARAAYSPWSSPRGQDNPPVEGGSRGKPWRDGNSARSFARMLRPLYSGSLSLAIATASVTARAEAQCADGSPPPGAGAVVRTPPAPKAGRRTFLLRPFGTVAGGGAREGLKTGGRLIRGEGWG